MASTQAAATKRAKLVLVNSEQYTLWRTRELPKLVDKYPRFNFIHMVDMSNGLNYVWYKTR